jgi:hypothetical protein
MSLLSGFFSLSKNTNKVNKGAGDETREGLVSDVLPELTLEMTDEELKDVKNKWIKRWDEYSREIVKAQEESERYWLGKHFKITTNKDERPLVDNLIFESTETFLPLVTRQNPEPMVETDSTEEGIALAEKVQKMLVFQADRQRLKLKVKSVVRHWAIYFLGCVKVGWSMQENDISTVVIRPQKLILDPESTINEGGEYQGEYIGEYRKDKASNLIKRFPNKKKEILAAAKDKLGSELQYIEWWSDEYVFWTMNDEVLGKSKNPHWNYDQKKIEEQVDEFGNVNKVQITIPGNNHFNRPKKPYVFLSVFNLGTQPHDATSLIQQSLAAQDLINKRLKQIDKNADNTNGGIAVSGDSFSKEQASEAVEAYRKGGGIYVPSGDIRSAVGKIDMPALPNFVYESLMDYRNELRNIFGVRGSVPQGTMSEKTVRGKILTKTQDADRSALISEYIEQFADSIFNWWTQLFYVYYDEPHSASVLGKERALEYIELINTDFNRKLTVSVKEGSLIPKDELTQRNEAIDLWSANALDPITLFDRLKFPNPRESAKQLFLWQSNPISLFPDLQAEQQAAMASQVEMAKGTAAEPAAPMPKVTQSPKAPTSSPLDSVPDLSQVPIQ